jgi:predicted membrane-bound spermidine synthase
MCVMALEMTASRLIAPYFGTSLYVWGNVLSIILVALTLGYWVGGQWADRSPRPETLLRVLLVGSGLALLAPSVSMPLATFVLAHLGGMSGSTLVIGGSLVVLVLLFAAPIFFMGMTSPFVIRLLGNNEQQGAGETSGSVFALSTVGSIVGTFLPAFWLVPELGTRATIRLFSGILLALVSVGLVGFRRSSGAVGAHTN